MESWEYIKEGTIILTQGIRTILLQSECDVESFLDYMNETIDNVLIGDSGEFNDNNYGYFE